MPKALKEIGFRSAELKDAGYTAPQLEDAGFSAADLRVGGFGADELALVSFSTEEIRAVRTPRPHPPVPPSCCPPPAARPCCNASTRSAPPSADAASFRAGGVLDQRDAPDGLSTQGAQGGWHLDARDPTGGLPRLAGTPLATPTPCRVHQLSACSRPHKLCSFEKPSQYGSCLGPLSPPRARGAVRRPTCLPAETFHPQPSFKTASVGRFSRTPS